MDPACPTVDGNPQTNRNQPLPPCGIGGSHGCRRCRRSQRLARGIELALGGGRWRRSRRSRRSCRTSTTSCPSAIKAPARPRPPSSLATPHETPPPPQPMEGGTHPSPPSLSPSLLPSPFPFPFFPRNRLLSVIDLPHTPPPGRERRAHRYMRRMS